MHRNTCLLFGFMLIGTVACGSSSSGGTGGAGGTGGTTATGGAGGAATGGSGGAATGGSGGAATGGSGGAVATGGTGGTVDAGLGTGGSGAGGLDGGSTGGATGTGGAGGKTGFETCDACKSCFKANGCEVIDNPCNDDPACNPKENDWHSCNCRATNAAQVAACDATFGAVGDKAKVVIECARQKCSVCANGGGVTCKSASPECQSCAITGCAAEIGACMAVPACGTAFSGLGPCACIAQNNGASASACLPPVQNAGGGAFVTCMTTKCGAVCGL
jgi:hypothetical protein